MQRHHVGGRGGGGGGGGRRKKETKQTSRNVANLVQKSTANQSQVKHVTRDTASGTSGKIDFNALAINPPSKYAEHQVDDEEVVEPEGQLPPPPATTTSVKKLVSFNPSADGLAPPEVFMDDPFPVAPPRRSSSAASRGAVSQASASSMASSFDVKADRLRGNDVMARYGFPSTVYPVVIPSLKRTRDEELDVNPRCNSAPNRHPHRKPPQGDAGGDRTILIQSAGKNRTRRDVEEEVAASNTQINHLCSQLESSLRGTKFQSVHGDVTGRASISRGGVSAKSHKRHQSGNVSANKSASYLGSRNDANPSRPFTAPSAIGNSGKISDFEYSSTLNEFCAFVDKSQKLNREIQQKIRSEVRGKLSKKELLHKAWTTRVFNPLMNATNSRFDEEKTTKKIQERRKMFQDFVDHVNDKGSAFLDDYNPAEYDPFNQEEERESEDRKEMEGGNKVEEGEEEEEARVKIVTTEKQEKREEKRRKERHCEKKRNRMKVEKKLRVFSGYPKHPPIDDPLHLQQTTQDLEERTINHLSDVLLKSLLVSSPTIAAIPGTNDDGIRHNPPTRGHPSRQTQFPSQSRPLDSRLVVESPGVKTSRLLINNAHGCATSEMTRAKHQNDKFRTTQCW